MVHSHKGQYHTVRMVPYRMVHCSYSDRALGSYSGTQEKMVFCNYSRSNYYILVKRLNSRVQSSGKQDVS